MAINHRITFWIRDSVVIRYKEISNLQLRDINIYCTETADPSRIWVNSGKTSITLVCVSIARNCFNVYGFLINYKLKKLWHVKKSLNIVSHHGTPGRPKQASMTSAADISCRSFGLYCRYLISDEVQSPCCAINIKKNLLHVKSIMSRNYINASWPGRPCSAHRLRAYEITRLRLHV